MLIFQQYPRRYARHRHKKKKVYFCKNFLVKSKIRLPQRRTAEASYYVVCIV